MDGQDYNGFRGLRLHNTLTGRKEDFVPFDPKNVRMYVCGPTVYDFAHIGNARPVIVFDVLFRLLRHLYGDEHVTYVRNITDVDDKIIHRAAEDFPDLPLNEAIGKVTATTEKQFHEDAAALGCLPPSVEPRATEHIKDMVAMIKTLVAEDYAYVREEHALFRVAAMKDYGQLSHRSLEDMIAGARVEVAPYKEDPMDFVLWKPSKPGEPAWPSPAGITTPGRPGWHIECSAMAKKHLGETFDIHGGGIDLVFPHHENEIAQSRCANHTDVMARTWMHNGYLQVEGRKMAKSEGNFVTIRDNLRGNFPGWEGGPFLGLVLKHAMLGAHYRQPIDWTLDRILASRSRMDWYYRVISNYLNEVKSEAAPQAVPELVDALNDDLNTPQALSVVEEVYSRSLNSNDRVPELIWCLDALGLFAEKARGAFGIVTGRQGAGKSFRDAAFAAMDAAVSLANNDPDFASRCISTVEEAGYKFVGVHGSYIDIDPVAKTNGSSIDSLVDARVAARQAKNFAEADRIRDELDAMGIQLKDAKDPKTGALVTTWEVKR